MSDEQSDSNKPAGGVPGPARHETGVTANAASWTGRSNDGEPSFRRYPHGRDRFAMDQFVQPDAPLTPHQFYPRVKFIGRKIPRILISPEAYKRMQLYVELARLEVGWLGTAERLESGDYYIEHVFLLRQNAGAAHARISVEGQTDLYNELCRTGRRQDTRRLQFWGHSHVRMDTQPSPQDDATMLELQEQRNKWFIRGILNKLGRASFDLYLFEQNMYFVDVPWEIWSPEPAAAVEEPKTGLAAVSEGLSDLKTKVLKGTRRFLETFSNDPVSKPEKETKGPLHISAQLRAEVEAEIRDKVTITYLPTFGGDYPYFPGAEGGDEPAQPPTPGAETGAEPGAEPATDRSTDRTAGPEKHLPGPPESLPPTTGGGSRDSAAPATSNAPDAKGE